MINKILLTLAVIVGVYLLVSFRKRRGVVSQTQAPVKQGRCRNNRCNKVGWLLAGSVLLAVGGFTLYVKLSRPDVVTIRVVNTQNGQAENFLASPDNVKNRSFKTLDGRNIILADTERMEVSRPR